MKPDKTLLSQIESIEHTLKQLLPLIPLVQELLSQQDELLDMDGFCELGHISKSSAYKILKECKSFKKGKRIYIKRSIAMQYFTSNKRMSVDEMKAVAASSITQG